MKKAFFEGEVTPLNHLRETLMLLDYKIHSLHTKLQKETLKV